MMLRRSPGASNASRPRSTAYACGPGDPCCRKSWKRATSRSAGSAGSRDRETARAAAARAIWPYYQAKWPERQSLGAGTRPLPHARPGVWIDPDGMSDPVPDEVVEGERSEAEKRANV